MTVLYGRDPSRPSPVASPEAASRRWRPTTVNSGPLTPLLSFG